MLFYFVGLADDGPLRIETFWNIKCDIIIEIFKERLYAFCWFSFVNVLSLMRSSYLYFFVHFYSLPSCLTLTIPYI